MTVINHRPKANSLTECKTVTGVKQETGVSATRPGVDRPREGSTSLQRPHQWLLLPVPLTKEKLCVGEGLGARP